MNSGWRFGVDAHEAVVLQVGKHSLLTSSFRAFVWIE